MPNIFIQQFQTDSQFCALWLPIIQNIAGSLDRAVCFDDAHSDEARKS
jgi:hypothetical protein